MNTMTLETVARQIYGAYADDARRDGVRMTAWGNLPADIRNRWIAVANEAMRMHRAGYLDSVPQVGAAR